MRVAVIGTQPNPLYGGTYTAAASVLEAVNSYTGGHTLTIYDGNYLASLTRKTQPRWMRAARGIAGAVGIRPLISPVVQRLREARQTGATGFEQTAAWDGHFRELGIDVVWFVGPGPGVGSIPYFTTVWDLGHRQQPYFPEVTYTVHPWDARERLYRRTLPRASKVITGTEVGKSQIVSFYGVAPENVVVVPLPTPPPSQESDGTPSPELRDKYQLEDDFLFYPAQFWAHKNHVNLLLALDLLKRKAGVEINLVLTGTDQGNLSYVREEVTALGLSSQVHILGFIPVADIQGLYREAVALVYPSFFGPDNLPPLEAFARGCPVVASRVPGAEEQLGDAALLFNPADPDDIADAIQRVVYRDPQLRVELIQRGQRLASTRTPQAYVAQICRLFDEFAPIRRCWA